jgi:hypothetical protein
MNLLYKDIREEESYKRGALKYGNGGVETRASKQGRRNKGVEILFLFKIAMAAYIRRAFNVKRSLKSSFSSTITDPLVIPI